MIVDLPENDPFIVDLIYELRDFPQLIYQRVGLESSPDTGTGQALQSSWLDPGDIALFVFDECHHATGKSPMGIILKDWKLSWFIICHNLLGGLEHVLFSHILGIIISSD